VALSIPGIAFTLTVLSLPRRSRVFPFSSSTHHAHSL
jgi:hypothetical protein